MREVLNMAIWRRRVATAQQPPAEAANLHAAAAPCGLAVARVRREPSPRPPWFGRALESPKVSSALALATIGTFFVVVYRNSVHGALLDHDVVLLLNSIHSGFGPLDGFLSHGDLWYGEYYYRPLFATQAWIFYRLFGLEFIGHQVSVLALHLISAFMVFFAISRITGRQLIGTVSALMYSAEPNVNSVVVNWVSDSMPLTNLLAILVLLMLAHQSTKLRWYLALFMALLLAPFTRENGIILLIAVMLYAAVGLFVGLLEARTAAKLTTIAIVAGIIYLGFRVTAFGLLPNAISPSQAAFFSRYYSVEEMAAIPATGHAMISIYVILANVVAVFVPVFGNLGQTAGYMLVATLAGSAAVMLFGRGILLLSAGWGIWTVRAKTIALMGGFLVTIPLVMIPIKFPLLARVIAQTLLSGAVLALLVAEIGRLSPKNKSLVILSLSVILVNGIVAFAYFRWRNLSVAFIGWLILVSVLLAAERLRGNLERLRPTFFLLAILIIILGGLELDRLLPIARLDPDNFDNAYMLCDERVSEELAMLLAREYGYAIPQVMECRSN